MRVGAHPGFDRVVIEFSGDDWAGFTTKWVTKPTAQGSGAPIEMWGNTLLQVHVTQIDRLYSGPEILKPRTTSSAQGTGLSAYYDGSNEGQGRFVIGLNSKRGYRIYHLTSPARLVLDFEKQPS